MGRRSGRTVTEQPFGSGGLVRSDSPVSVQLNPEEEVLTPIQTKEIMSALRDALASADPNLSPGGTDDL